MPSLAYKPVKTVNWKGLTIKIENPAGSVREGVSKSGKKWSTEMPYDYGYVENSKGVDGDEVDVFLGPDKSSPNVFIMHQLKKESGEFDEQKCFLGFTNTMDAMQAYRRAYDLPNLFIGSMETIPFETFKEKVLATKRNPVVIHARGTSKTESVLYLYAQNSPSPSNPISKGDPVTVNGFHGRGVVVDVRGDVVTIRFRSGEYISRNYSEVQRMSDNTISKMWRY